MDILLPQIRDFLREEIDFVREADICLIPNPGVIPEGAGLPYIGIKDGAVIIRFGMIGGGQGKDMTVEVYVYDRLDRSDDNILGLHDKAREVSSLLGNHCFAGDMDSPEPTSQTPVVLLYTKKGLVIRKGLVFKYEREE